MFSEKGTRELPGRSPKRNIMKRLVHGLLAAALCVILIYALLTFFSARERYAAMEERLRILRQEAESLHEENERMEENIFLRKADASR